MPTLGWRHGLKARGGFELIPPLLFRQAGSNMVCEKQWPKKVLFLRTTGHQPSVMATWPPYDGLASSLIASITNGSVGWWVIRGRANWILCPGCLAGLV